MRFEENIAVHWQQTLQFFEAENAQIKIKRERKWWEVGDLCKLLNSVKLPDLSQASSRPPDKGHLRSAPVCSLRRKFIPSSVKQTSNNSSKFMWILSVKHTKLRIQRKQETRVTLPSWIAAILSLLMLSKTRVCCKSARQISTQLTRCKTNLILSRKLHSWRYNGLSAPYKEKRELERTALSRNLDNFRITKNHVIFQSKRLEARK